VITELELEDWTLEGRPLEEAAEETLADVIEKETEDDAESRLGDTVAVTVALAVVVTIVAASVDNPGSSTVSLQVNTPSHFKPYVYTV